jgi:hypothetical protein
MAMPATLPGHCRSRRQARALAVGYACRNGLTGPRITVRSPAAGLDRCVPPPALGQLSSGVEKNAVWRGGGGCMHVDGGSMRGR